MTDNFAPEPLVPAADSIEVPLSIPPSQPRRNRLWRLVVEAVEMLLLVVIIYIMVNLVTARAYVDGKSMEPTLETGQIIIVSRVAYVFSKPMRGDIVVLHNPSQHCKNIYKNRSLIPLPFLRQDDPVPDCDDLIKRVIGLPGDTVQFIGGAVYINGVKLDEPYIADENRCTICGERTWRMGDEQYFVLGDNRMHSNDGDDFGPIKGDSIVGQAWLRYWPLGKFGILPRPVYAPIPQQGMIPSPTPTYPYAPVAPSGVNAS